MLIEFSSCASRVEVIDGLNNYSKRRSGRNQGVMNPRQFAIISGFGLFISLAGFCQSPFYDVAAPLELTIRADYQTLFKDRELRGPNVHRSTLEFVESGIAKEIQMNLTLRGGGRRSHPMPPMKIEFDQRLVGGVFDGIKELKLVTHSYTLEEREQNPERKSLPADIVVQEYLIYKIYNQFSDKAFKVRQARIKYQDIGGHVLAHEFGFFFEDTGDFAKRFNSKNDRALGLKPENILPESYATVAFFKWMVGDFDWAIEPDHPVTPAKNVEILKTAEGDRFLVPKDFDLARMIRKSDFVVTENIKGLPCLSEEQIDQLIAKGLALYEPTVSIFQDEPLVSEESRIRVKAYLASFSAAVQSGTVKAKMQEKNCKVGKYVK